MTEIHYFEGAQRIQREAVLEVLSTTVLVVAEDYQKCEECTEFLFDANEFAAERVLQICEQRASQRFGGPVLVLRRRGLPDLTLRIVTFGDPCISPPSQ